MMCSGRRKRLLNPSWYIYNDALYVARSLIGKMLFTRIDGLETICRIVETEAYNGVEDKASHAYGGRRTPRAAAMYKRGGHAYVYLCYGVHHLFNVVTAHEGSPQAVLIRAGEPMLGIETMALRVQKKATNPTITKGPGNMSKALGIHLRHNGCPLSSYEISIWDDGFDAASKDIVQTTRIGVDYAGEDALLPYRFYLRGNTYVSRK